MINHACRSKLILAIFSLLLVLPFCAQVALAENREFFVSNTGVAGCSDSNNGSLSNPFCTIERAAEAAASSTSNITIYLREGIYLAGGINFAHYKLSWVHLRNYPGERPVIDCNGRPAAFFLENGIIEGLEIMNFSYYGIICYPGKENSTISIINNKIHSCGMPSQGCHGIRIMGGKNRTVEGNEIFNISSHGGSAIYYYSGSSGTIDNNVIHGNYEGIHVAGSNNSIYANVIFNNAKSNGIFVSGSGNRVQNNTVFENRNNVILQECPVCVFSGNLVYSSGNGTGVSVIKSPKAEILRNTIYNVRGPGITAGSSHFLRIMENIIYNASKAALHMDSFGYIFESDYNLLHSASGRPVMYNGSAGGQVYKAFSEYQNETGQDRHSILHAEPLFVDVEQHDFRLAAGSPLCNASANRMHIGAFPCVALESQPASDEQETICVPHWGCTEWSLCLNGTKKRECFDWNGCNDDSSIPSETTACQKIEHNQTADRNATTDVNATDEAAMQNGSVFPPADNTENATTRRIQVIENFSKLITRISPGQPGSVDIEKHKIGIRNIKIKVKKDVADICINVTAISGRPAQVKHNVTGTVYQYLEITHENITDSDIDMVTISFEVNKSWFAETNTNKSNVFMSRYIINQWTVLPTMFVNETDDKAYYKALSPGLSLFSIVAASVLSGSNRTCVPYDIRCEGKSLQECDMAGEKWVTSQTCEYGCSDIKGCLGSEPKNDGSWMPIIVMAAVIIILCIAAYYFQSRRERLTQEIRELQSTK